MTKPEPSTCPNCGGPLHTSRGAARFRRYGKVLVELPADLEFPACDQCGAEWLTDDDVLRVDDIVERALAGEVLEAPDSSSRLRRAQEQGNMSGPHDNNRCSGCGYTAGHADDCHWSEANRKKAQRKRIHDQAHKIVGRLLADLQDRRGLRQAWEDIDSGVQQEIQDAWIYIVSKVLD